MAERNATELTERKVEASERKSTLDRPKPCLNPAKYPDWPFIPWEEQSEYYFRTVRGLHNSGVNPQSDVNRLPVTDQDIAEIFGPLRKLTVSNPLLDPQTLEVLIEKYWRCYGTDDVTNGTFQKWFISAYIAEEKGVEINWCKAAVRTAREKDRRRNSFRVRSGEIRMSELSTADVRGLGVGERADSKSHIIDQDLKVGGGFCPYGVSSVSLEGVGDVLVACSDLLMTCREKIAEVEALRTSTRDKLGRFEQNTENRRADVSEYEEMVVSYQNELAKVTRQIEAEEGKVCLGPFSTCILCIYV